MAPIRIQDTLSGEIRDSSPTTGRGRDLRLRSDRLRAHPHRQRAPVRDLHPAEAIPGAPGDRREAGHQRHRHQRQDLRRGARGGQALRRVRGRDDRGVYGGHGRARARPPGRRAARLGDDRGDRLSDRGADRRGPRLPGERRRLLPGSELRGLREALQPRSRRDGPGGGGRHRLAQGGPARLRALEGPQGGRGHLLGLALGEGPARAGTSSARRCRRRSSGRTSRSTAAASTSSSPTTRTRSRRPRPPGASRSPRSGCTTGWSRSTRRRCRSRSATSSSSRRRSSASAGRRWSPTSISGHYRQPLAFSEEQLEEAAARVDRIRNYFRDAPPGGRTTFLVEKRQAFLDALADDFNTPQAFAVLFEIVAEGNKRELSGAREGLEELLPLLGLDSLLEERTRRLRRGGEAALRARGGPCGEGLRAGRRASRRARRDGLGGPRRGGRGPARPAPLRCRSASGSTAAGRSPRPSGAGAACIGSGGRRRPPPEELERLCGSPDHQGVVAEVDPYPYADPARCSSRGCARRRARPDPGPPQPRRGLPGGRGGGRGRRGDPRAARCVGDAGGVQGVGGGGRAPAGGAGEEPGRLARRGEGGRGLGVRGGGGGRARLHRGRLVGPGRARARLGGIGLRPRVAESLRRAGLDPVAGRSAR